MDNNMNQMEPAAEEKINPWLSIWIQPRYTMRKILDGNRGPVILLAALGGIADSLARISEKNGYGYNSLLGILSMSIVSGIIGGIIGVYIISGLLRLTGRWIGGKGSYEEILTAIAWSNVPTIWSLLIWFLGIVVFGINFFKDASMVLEASVFLNILSWLFSTLFLLIGVWSIFISVKCIAEAQQFSSWMAVLNYVLAFLVIFIPVLVLVMLFRVV